MKIIHQIVVSIFVAVATFSPQVVYGAKECSYDGHKTNHNEWYEGPTEECRCDDGKWKDCSNVKNHDSGSTSNNNNNSNNKKDCWYNNKKTNHGSWWDGPDERCKCDNERWIECKNHDSGSSNDNNNSNNSKKDCWYNDKKTNHGSWWDGPDERCKCDNERWIECYPNDNNNSNNKECWDNGKETSHNEWYKRRDGDTCKCYNEKWIECYNNNKNPTRRPTRKPSRSPTRQPTRNWKKCQYDSHWTDHNEWYEGSKEKCKCYDGEWRDCEDHNNNNNNNNKPDNNKCWANDRYYSSSEWHEDDGQRCYCNWDGSWKDCEDLNRDDGCKTILDIACSRSDLSKFCQAVKNADLRSALDDMYTDFTVFAPSNDALDGFRINGKDFNDINLYTRKKVLLTHVVKDRVLDEGNLRNRCGDLLTMATEKNTRTICKRDNGFILYQKGNGNSDNNKPKVIKSDIDACNGIVHVVSKVILP